MLPFTTNKPYTFDRFVRLLLFLALLYGVFRILNYLSDVLIPFAVALILAYLLNPLVVFVQYRLRVKKRGLSVMLTLLLVLGLLAGVFSLLVPRLVQDVQHMGEMVTDYVNNSALQQQVQQYLPENLQQWITDFANRIEISELLKIENLEKATTLLAQKILPGIWGIFSGSMSVITTLLGFTVILMYLVFMLLDYPKIAGKWHTLLPVQFRPAIIAVVTDVENSMNTYFRAQALIALIVGIITAIGFSIIGLPMGVALGLFIGLLNMVPYLQIVGFIPAVFFALLHALDTGQSFWVMMGLVILVQVIGQIIQDVFLTPKIMGDATGLNPAIIILSLSVWGKLLGILGLIIALPLTSVIIGYYHRFLQQSEPPPLLAIENAGNKQEKDAPENDHTDNNNQHNKQQQNPDAGTNIPEITD
ncbi:AI-2E family transporter [Sphingobacteriales bacterium UPWRP_1]|nr:hypothetical protein BVG80_13580 [Sphingobacteriales bacterium TSM_CSM]PSJ75355.1 AI-2E family transporter [Sphingobacteriales bacterium UPWRP_1]